MKVGPRWSWFERVLLGIFCLAFASGNSLGIAADFVLTSERHILDNGLTVLLTPFPSSPTMALYACVKTGSATEGRYLGSGISHFVEHMLFKGTLRRSVGKISEEIKRLGGQINASTSFDYTIYTVELPEGLNSFEKGLDIMADMLMNSQFPPEEVERERAVILAEMKLHHDNPDRRLSELVFENVFFRHPYRHPIIGHKALFEKVSRQDLLDYYHSTYTPNNIIISVAGKFDPDPALKQIEQAFKNFKPQPYRDRNLPQEPSQITPRDIALEYPTDLTRLSLSYQGVALLDKDMVALDVLAMILGQGESSRLHLDIYKKKGLVHSISSGNFTPMDKGIFSIECLLDFENVLKTIDTIKQDIVLIQQNGVSLPELEKAKRQVLSDHVFGSQTPAQIAYQTAIDEAFVGDLNFSKKYIEAVRRVKSDDIQRVARHYLKEESLTTAILKPLEDSLKEEKRSEQQHPAEIEKFTLDNGLVILVREDHSLPVISMNVVINGGTRQENWFNNGLSELTSRLWVKGTQTRSARDIAQEVESWGASLNGFSGRNSLGVTINILSDNLKSGLDLLEDLIRNPSFDRQELARIKRLMKAVILEREDDIFDVTAKALRQTLFLTHPLRLETLGNPESLDRLTREDVVDFYKRFAVPPNMVLTVFGDLKKQDVLELLKKKFSSLKRQEVFVDSKKEDPPSQMREKKLFLDKEQAMVMIGFQGPPLSNKDRFGLEVLSSVLSAPLNGRLFLRIREEFGQSYTLGGGYTPGLDLGFIYFYVATNEESVYKVKDLLIEEIRALQKEKLSESELTVIKTYLKGSFTMALQTNAALSFASGLDELYGLGYNYYRRYGEEIDQVSPEGIQRLARTYLDPQKSAIVVTRPSPGRDLILLRTINGTDAE